MSVGDYVKCTECGELTWVGQTHKCPTMYMCYDNDYVDEKDAVEIYGYNKSQAAKRFVRKWLDEDNIRYNILVDYYDGGFLVYVCLDNVISKIRVEGTMELILTTEVEE